MEKQLFFSMNVKTPFENEEQLMYEPFWQLGILKNEETRMQRIEALLGVNQLQEERTKVRKQQQLQRDAIQTALEVGFVTAWIGPSAGEELAFMELAERLNHSERLTLRLVPGPLHIHERAPALFTELAQQPPLTKKEWSVMVPSFSNVEHKQLVERIDRFTHEVRKDGYFDPEILEALRQFKEPVPIEKVVATVYAQRPEYPVAFYFQRVSENIRKGYIKKEQQAIYLHDELM
ncbi:MULTISPECIES: hypothetical protein [Bacillaceae]|uniref:Uncharacterized protein n=1 Tax=Alkalicoccobacillus plakortidis TaxID=444060 RepID=A0A9D5I287_9BACI|nr:MULTISPECIES: hypothetical protein [Bacillaceae]KQL59109.1 hypothetical protein AN965_00275 [Alkalicoccobacillus plakortidis]